MTLKEQIKELRERLEAIEKKSAEQATIISLLRAQIAELKSKPDPFRPIGPRPDAPWKLPEKPWRLPVIIASPNTAPVEHRVSVTDQPPPTISKTAETARSDA